MPQKVEKVHNFLDPPSPRMFWTFLDLGKIGNFGKNLNWENFEILESPLRKKQERMAFHRGGIPSD